MDYLTLEFEDRPKATLNVPVIAAVDTAASVLMSSPAPAALLALPKEIE